MAVAFNAVTQAAGAATSFTLAHTTAGQTRAVVFACAYFTALGTGFVSPPTCAGVEMVPLGAEQGAGLVAVSLWGRVGPPLGSAPCSVTWDGSADYVAAAMSYTGVHQTTPFGTPQRSSGSVSPVLVALPGTLEGNMIVDCAGINLTNTFATAAPHAGQTQRQNAVGGVSPTRLRLVASDELAGGDASMSWTLSQARLWAQAACELLAAPSGAVHVRGRHMIRSLIGSAGAE